MGILLSRKLIESTKGRYLHWCPGCKSRHIVSTDVPNSVGAIWQFDGNVEYPTFTPSVHIPAEAYRIGDSYMPRRIVCHYTLREGILSFFIDSGHTLAGSTMPLPDLPQATLDYYMYLL